MTPTRSARLCACWLALFATAPACAQQVCPPGFPLTTPDGDFADNGNGTVRHIPTGLIWKRCAEGQTWDGSNCTGSATGYGWWAALARVVEVNGGASDSQNAGQTDWRLPNIHELHAVQEHGCALPSINLNQFPAATAGAYWSSTPRVGSTQYVWIADFGQGHDDWLNDSNAAQVRLVRAGEGRHPFDAAATPPVITSAAPPDGTVGSPYTFTVTATGTAPITFSATGLPAGLAIDPASGVISGTPTVHGSTGVLITATNPTGPTTQSYTVTIAAAALAPAITSPAPPGGRAGAPYTFTVTATGTAPITFSATGLPAGLAIDPASGVISGIPVGPGNWNVAITASNAAGPATRGYTIAVEPAAIAPTLTTPALPDSALGSPYSFTVTAVGTAPITFGASGLPAGLAIDPATGVISGTPAVPGSYGVSITASNAVGPATQSYPLVVAQPTAAAPQAIPTLTQWGMAALSMLLAGVALLGLRRR